MYEQPNHNLSEVYGFIFVHKLVLHFEKCLVLFENSSIQLKNQNQTNLTQSEIICTTGLHKQQ